MTANHPTGTRILTGALILGCVVHLALTPWLITPGPLSIDEGFYHLATKAMAEGNGFTIKNGFDEFPSRELWIYWPRGPWLTPAQGRLVAPYPYLFPLIAAPLYQWWNFAGLIAVNALAFPLLVWLTVALGQVLFRDRKLALTGALILVCSTFAWDYSQTAWPHILSAVFAVAPFVIGLRTTDPPRPRQEQLAALGAGVIIGLGAGIRLDAIFLLPALCLIYLTQRRQRIALCIAATVGVLPGIALLAITNHFKYGTWWPFYYGSAGISADASFYERFLPVGILCATWLYCHGFSRRRWWILAAVGLSFLIHPTVRQAVATQLHGIWYLLGDLRLVDPERAALGMPHRGVQSVLYMGGLKKALLQSCPYLPVTIIAAWHALRWTTPDTRALRSLWIVPCMFFAVYAYAHWAGGLCLNLRYFVSVLPFFSLLTAYALKHLLGQLSSRRPMRWTLLPALITLFLLATLLAQRPARPQQEAALLLDLPLVFSALVAAATISFLLMPQRWAPLRRIAVLLVSVTLGWATAVAYFYDVPITRQWRQRSLRISRKTSAHLPSDVVLFTEKVDPFYPLADWHTIRFANPFNDRFADFKALASFHMDKSRGVYAAFSPSIWRTLHDRGIVAPEAVRMLGDIGGNMRLGQILDAR